MTEEQTQQKRISVQNSSKLEIPKFELAGSKSDWISFHVSNFHSKDWIHDHFHFGYNTLQLNSHVHTSKNHFRAMG